MITAKEFEGELWIKASDYHQIIKEARREWVGLTEEDIKEIWLKEETTYAALKMIEAKLKERNG